MSNRNLIASQPNLMHVSSMQPSNSNVAIPVEQSTNDNRLEEFKAVFPDIPVEQLVNTLQTYENVAKKKP